MATARLAIPAADVPLDLDAAARRPGAVRGRRTTRAGARPAQHADVLPRLPVQGAAADHHRLPGQIDYGSTMDLVTPQAADIAKVSLVSLASVTHTADWSQHFEELPFTRSGTTLTVVDAGERQPRAAELLHGLRGRLQRRALDGQDRQAGRGAAPVAHHRPGVAHRTGRWRHPHGSPTLAATATDNIGVAGVRFLVDGVDAGAEDATSPTRSPGAPRRWPTARNLSARWRGTQPATHLVRAGHCHGEQHRTDQRPGRGVVLQRGQRFHRR